MTDAFSEHRRLLFTVAYEMLGSAADAEDVLQESWLRWSEVDHAGVRDPRAYLVRIVTRQSLNRLRTVRRQREQYVGPWLPEPLLTTHDVAEDVELADAVSIAMLVVLETLSPLERAVFVLHEVFGFSYDEIAAATDRTPAAVRQVASRARNHVAARRPRMTAAADDSAEVTQRFFEAAATGDVQQLLEVLAPDVVLLSDGGGKTRAALRPITGADKVVRWLDGVRPAGLDVGWTTANGSPAVLLYVDGVLDSVASVWVLGGRVQEIYLVRNPDKLVGVAKACP
ncbi:MAG: RNA polymerase sigma-70 factor [Nocardioidaceae bacterium]